VAPPVLEQRILDDGKDDEEDEDGGLDEKDDVVAALRTLPADVLGLREGLDEAHGSCRRGTRCTVRLRFRVYCEARY
jgi:hypothetical protein